MNKSARNERRKLTATFLNTLASGVIIVGGLAPLAAWFYGGSYAPAGPLSAGFLICMAITVGLHLLGRLMLQGIEE